MRRDARRWSQLDWNLLDSSGQSRGALTEGDDDGARDAVRHHHGEDVHDPGVRGSKLELVGLMLKGQDGGVNKTIIVTPELRPGVRCGLSSPASRSGGRRLNAPDTSGSCT